MTTTRPTESADDAQPSRNTAPDMTPLPPRHLYRETLDALTCDPLTLWLVGISCGLLLAFIALEIGFLAMEYRIQG